jgi:hypothetical protein
MIQTKIKASQYEKKTSNGTKIYELWLEVALDYQGAKSNWCVKLDTREEIAFDTTYTETHFSSWFGLRLITGTPKALLFAVSPPHHQTAEGNALIKEVSDWLYRQGA